VPWGWGLSDMGSVEGQRELPRTSELNNPAIEAVCRPFAELRYRLMPYTYTLTQQARDTGMPLMRALWLHYPNDVRALGLATEYLWGRDLLIAPVFTPGAKSREVYLPEGDWYDWWTHEKQAGSRSVTRHVNLSEMPIYVRAGAIIPLDPVRQYVEEAVTEPTTLEVYAGADGQFVLYDDDGRTLDYMQGQGTWTRLTWHDGQKRLQIEPDPRSGGPATARRPFRIRLIPGGIDKTVEYVGQPLQVDL